MATKIRIKEWKGKKTTKQEIQEKKSIYDADYDVQKSLLARALVIIH